MAQETPEISSQIIINPNYDYFKSSMGYNNTEVSEKINALNNSLNINYSYYTTSVTWTSQQQMVISEESPTPVYTTIWTSAATYGEIPGTNLLGTTFVKSYESDGIGGFTWYIYFSLPKPQNSAQIEENNAV